MELYLPHEMLMGAASSTLNISCQCISYCQLLSVAISYHQLPSVRHGPPSGYQLLSVAISYHQLLSVTISYGQIPSVTVSATWAPLRPLSRRLSLLSLLALAMLLSLLALAMLLSLSFLEEVVLDTNITIATP